MNRTLIRMIAAAASLAMPLSGLSAREAGTSGFLFLRLGSGARAGGMGEAFTAVADDAAGIYYNPAGMAAVEGVELCVPHAEWVQDIRFEQITVLNEMFGGTAGLSFTGLYYGEMDRYGDYPSLVPDGTFAPYDLSIAGGYAMDVLPNLSVGAAVKVIYEKIDFESATGWAFDAGLMHKSAIEGLTLAASLQNLGPQAKFVEEKFYPPFTLRGGAAYRYGSPWLHGNAILAADALFPNDGDAKIHLGLEYNYGSHLSVRTGYKGNYYAQGFTLGAGVKYRSLAFDYAYMPLDFELGDSHRISIRVASPAP
jgi:long-subunit fatty acid transport protein